MAEPSNTASRARPLRSSSRWRTSFGAMLALALSVAGNTAFAQHGRGGGRGHRSAGAARGHDVGHRRAPAQPARRRAPQQTQRPHSTKAYDAAGERRSFEAQTERGRGGNQKANVDRSRRDVEVNVDRSRHVELNRRNTVVRANPRPYSRPPYVYGGRRYYAYHPYHYHAYRPYYWGPAWHPWGFFAATLAATAIVVSVNNQQYHYDQGVYYLPSDGGYTVVAAPVGATVPSLPSGAQTVVVNETNNYYYGGTYYEKTPSGYTVVAPTAGTVVESLPAGGEEVKVGDQTYVRVGDTYYQPIVRDGKNMYEVVEVRAES